MATQLQLTNISYRVYLKPASAGTSVDRFELRDNTKGDILCMLMVARSVTDRLERSGRKISWSGLPVGINPLAPELFFF